MAAFTPGAAAADAYSADFAPLLAAAAQPAAAAGDPDSDGEAQPSLALQVSGAGAVIICHATSLVLSNLCLHACLATG